MPLLLFVFIQNYFFLLTEFSFPTCTFFVFLDSDMTPPEVKLDDIFPVEKGTICLIWDQKLSLGGLMEVWVGLVVQMER